MAHSGKVGWTAESGKPAETFAAGFFVGALFSGVGLHRQNAGRDRNRERSDVTLEFRKGLFAPEPDCNPLAATRRLNLHQRDIDVFVAVLLDETIERCGNPLGFSI
jgi:hypothetical protein